ncbi:DUF805 domain-containing protein [Hymenobacter sp. HSC-4F20]|uniref:DUF805 domain-containing protein n=1 Tax=Hymenobacter sp. HSC-4F20 TaxID=2864135 RepID=UPI001C7370A9|nr:DUF805 domain-containing protein [Hymenobacter sp. HSC-4F20]MBX0291990.1 DUF805 domain-containing protein [Hymenobacter sp. HSC-4F20]
MALLQEYQVLWGRQERLDFAVEIAPALLPLILLYALTPAGQLPPVWLASCLWLLATALVAILAVRRLHDVGRSGWYALLLLVPVFNALLLVLLLLQPGLSRPTRHGVATRLRSVA